MSTPDQRAAPDPPVLYVGQQDTSRLLEVYVKRSLSLNDGSPYARRPGGRQRKWVTQAERSRRNRMHSSDTSLHLSVDKEELEDSAFAAAGNAPAPPSGSQMGDKASRQRWNTLRTRWKSFKGKGRRPSKPSRPPSWVNSSGAEGKAKEPDTAASDLESSTEKPAANQSKSEGRKVKKPSFWKSIIGLFSRGDSDTDERDPSPMRTVDAPQPDELPTPPVNCLPLPRAFPEGEEGSPRRRKSTKRRRSRKRLSLKLDRPSSLVVEGWCAQDTIQSIQSLYSQYSPSSQEMFDIYIIENTDIYYKPFSLQIYHLHQEGFVSISLLL